VPVNSSSGKTVTFTGVPSNVSFSQQSGINEFSIGSPSCGGSTCSLPITFSPAYPGLREGSITATNSSGALIGLAILYGVGTGPQISISPGVISTVANRSAAALGSATPSGIALGAPGNLFISDSTNNVVYYINTQNGQVTPFAGNGTRGYSGNGGPAGNAQLSSPSGLAFDSAGDLYIADNGNNVVRRVDAFSGVITTVAGNGSAGYSGDGGPATSAQLSAPNALALGPAGDLYIADTHNNRIREVLASNGNITTFAGNGSAGYTGDHGPATSAELDLPTDVALDSNGNVYIADSASSVIREVVSGTITTVAGIGGSSGFSGDGGPATSATLNGAQAVAVDAARNIYIADTGNQAIRKVTGNSSHTITTVAGTPNAAGYSGDGGASTIATLNVPTHLTLDGAADVFIVDSNNYAIREVTATPASLTFPPTDTGSTSSPLTLTVSNTGNENLALSGLSASGNFSQQSSTNPCSASSTLTEGSSCTVAIAFSPTSGGHTSGSLSITDNSLNTSTANQTALSESSGLRFIPVTPCRVVDTRNTPDGPFAGPMLSKDTSRDFTIPDGACSIPSTAQAYSLNVTAVPSGSTLGYLRVWPAGQTEPKTSTVNSEDGRAKANAAIIPAGSGGAISVYTSDDTQLVLDIDGYFVPESTSSALAYYPLNPCRVADTRINSGGEITGGTTRTFDILSSPCDVPSTARAYSFNFTAVPHQSLGYVTTWPAGQAQPKVSTLNAPTEAVTANAAIVPAGSGGEINVFASNNTDLVIDINGYFAPPATGGLSLYNLQPCRVLDTRSSSGSFSGTLNVNVAASACTVPPVAQAYVMNLTVVPPAPLGYLSTWPSGAARPYQSTLNSGDGVVMSNLAIVPTTNGSIDAFASNATQLVVDIFGYMAP
ncbi:MAG: choice-of-anchor D domain-containing protein, partial [Bryobacteraceae bacterium]